MSSALSTRALPFRPAHWMAQGLGAALNRAAERKRTAASCLAVALCWFPALQAQEEARFSRSASPSQIISPATQVAGHEWPAVEPSVAFVQRAQFRPFHRPGARPQNESQPQGLRHPQGVGQPQGYRPQGYGPQNYPQAQNNGQGPNNVQSQGYGHPAEPNSPGSRQPYFAGQPAPFSPLYGQHPQASGPENTGRGAAPTGVNGQHLSQWMQSHRNMPLPDQQNALSREPGFNQLPAQQQQRMRDHLTKLNNMAPAERQRAIDRTEQMERLSPPQRQQIRGTMQQLSSLPEDRRRAVARGYRSLRDLPESQRQAYLNSPQARQQYTEEERGTLNRLLSISPLLPQ